MLKSRYFVIIIFLFSCNNEKKEPVVGDYEDTHRPQIHFTPKTGWMNDPNGMVYINNQYHLFYQHYPDSTVWGPMHWGHATSKDLIHWEQQPLALYPDSLGYIFSGSSVVDANNTSGFGKDGKAPLIAIFTHHSMEGEKAGTDIFQTQSIAYSLDEGRSWVKYSGNPVLKNPGIKDFRDPKVMWFEEGKKWIMTLATKDRITFYSAKDLKHWVKESEFGAEIGAHGGVWECPDLFPLEYDGENIWILLVSINPGGPNGGSATQYFTGKFDGKNFIPFQTDTRWVDYGKDDYAGVTWSNTGKRKIFIGWMSNWQYANLVPTEKWRSAATIPRDLGVEKVGDRYMLTSKPVDELNNINEASKILDNITVANYDLSKEAGKITGPVKLNITAKKIEDFSFTFSNASGDTLVAGFEKASNSYYIDRSKSGKVDFEKEFSGRHTAPRLSDKDSLELTIIIDNASIELFADNGLSVMTDIFFPNQILSDISFRSSSADMIKKIEFSKLKSIWR